MRSPALVLLLLTLRAAGPGGAEAQIAGHLDAGSGTLRLGTEAPFGVVRLAPSLTLSNSNFLLDTEGDFAGHTEHGWQTNGHLRGAVRQRLGVLEGRLGIDGGGSRTRWGRSAGGWLGHGRLQVGSARQGFALGVGSGRSFARGSSQPLSRMEAGGWGRFGRVDLGLWLKRTGLTVPGDDPDDRSPVDTFSVGDGERRTLKDHYTDLEATIGWSRGSLALEGSAGRRFGKTVRFTSWHIQALYQVTDRVALVASSGQFPVDVVSGLPSGGFTTLSMRFNLRTDPPVQQALSLERVREGTRSFFTRASLDGTCLITVVQPGADRVEMMGDFTDWIPVLLVPDSQNRWNLRMRIPPGVHEVNVRVDGGDWTVPAGLSTREDGLGGTVGLFVVE